MSSKSRKKSVLKPPVEAKPPKQEAKPRPIEADTTQSSGNGGNVPSASWWDSIKQVLDTLYGSGVCTEQKLPREVAKVLMLKGWELDLKPLAALDSLRITEDGRIGAATAELQRALARKVGGSIIPTEMTEKRCVVVAKRGSEQATFEFTVEEAAQKGLLQIWDRNKGASRTDMLFARCTTRAARAMFADALYGLSYTAEELSSVQVVSAPEFTPLAEKIKAGAGEAPAVQAKEPSQQPEQRQGAPASEAGGVEEAGKLVPAEDRASRPSPTPPATEPEKRAEQPNALEPVVVLNQNTRMGRLLDRLIVIRGKDGPDRVMSGGITGDQVDAVRAFYAADVRHKDRITEIMREMGWAKLSHLNQDEASDLIKRMQDPVDLENRRQPRDEKRLIDQLDQPITMEEAKEEFRRIVYACDLGDGWSWEGKDDCAMWVATGILRKDHLTDLTAADWVVGGNAMRLFCRENPAGVKLAMERALALVEVEGPFTHGGETD